MVGVATAIHQPQRRQDTTEDRAKQPKRSLPTACASSVQAARQALWHAYGARSLASGADSSGDKRGHGVVRGRLGVPELLRNLATVGFPACPRIGLVKTRNGGILACVEPGKRSIDCIFRRHDDRRCLLRRVARDVLKPRRPSHWAAPSERAHPYRLDPSAANGRN
jgi:hypothetical protein